MSRFSGDGGCERSGSARGRAASATGWSHAAYCVHMVRCRPATQWNTVVGFADKLVVDGVSWRILSRGSCVRLSGDSVWANTHHSMPPGTSFRRWTEQLATEATSSGANCRTAAVDLDRLGRHGQLLSAPAARSRTRCREACRSAFLTSVCPPRLRWICSLVSQRSFHCRIDDVLLAAFALAVWDWRGLPQGRTSGLGTAGPGRARPRGSF